MIIEMLKNKGESKLTFILEDLFSDESSSLYCSIAEHKFQKNFVLLMNKIFKRIFN